MSLRSTVGLGAPGLRRVPLLLGKEGGTILSQVLDDPQNNEI